MNARIFSIIFSIFFVSIWVIVLVSIISAFVKIGRAGKNVSSRRRNSAEYNEAYRQLTGRNTSRNSAGRVSAASAQRNENISDANAKRAQKQLELGSSSSARKLGYDDYSKASRKNRTARSKTTSGYDRTYIDNSSNRRKQYSHTFDGHEPWDDCLPKEKDPWDKNFYSGRG